MSNARISFDLSESDAAGSTFTVAPAGDYDVVIDNVEEAESKSVKNAGKPMYVVYFKSLDESFTGTQRTYACLWHEARYTLLDLMKATGFKVEAGKLVVPEADEFIGKEVTIKLEVETYTNKEDEQAERNSVKSIKAIGGKKPAAKKAPAKGKAAGGFAL